VKKPKLGATGNFPHGKLNPTDEGELQMGMTSIRSKGVVRIDFGKPITWFALRPAEARAFAEMLIERANALERP
jgi:hypothetical protein